MPKIAIIDDHKLFSSGLSLLLSELDEEMEVDTFESIENFVGKNSINYSAIILDFYLPGSDFTETMHFFSKQVNSPVIIVSATPSPADITLALSTGAKAFISKNSDPEELLNTVSSVLGGNFTSFKKNAMPNSQLEKYGLTPRHLDVLLIAVKGCSNKEIAAYLNISPETVKTHLKTSYQRIGVQNRIEAIEFMRQHGLF